MTSGRRRILVAVNPEASFGHRAEAGQIVESALLAAGHEVVVLRKADAESLRSAIATVIADAGPRRPDALVVVGGDGAVSLAVNLLAGGAIPLGIVPTGTGNDMARGLGVPLGDLDAAMAHLLAALAREPRTIDLALARHAGGTVFFAGALSAGFDALVNERANAWRRPRGRSRYTLAILRELLTLRPRRYALEIDGEASQTESVLISVANNTSIGGGMRIVPEARLDDGLLDLFVVAPLSRLRFLRVFPRVYRGTHTGLDVVTIRRASRIRLDCLSEGAVVAYADGERLGPLPVEIRAAPSALRVLA